MEASPREWMQLRKQWGVSWSMEWQVRLAVLGTEAMRTKGSQQFKEIRKMKERLLPTVWLSEWVSHFLLSFLLSGCYCYCCCCCCCCCCCLVVVVLLLSCWLLGMHGFESARNSWKLNTCLTDGISFLAVQRDCKRFVGSVLPACFKLKVFFDYHLLCQRCLVNVELSCTKRSIRSAPYASRYGNQNAWLSRCCSKCWFHKCLSPLLTLVQPVLYSLLRSLKVERCLPDPEPWFLYFKACSSFQCL